MHKHDVVVEQEDVEDEHSKLHKEGHEEADKATRLCLFVEIVHLEEITIQVLICHIDHADNEKVQTGRNAIPGNEFAGFDREAADVGITQLVDKNEKTE